MYLCATQPCSLYLALSISQPPLGGSPPCTHLLGEVQCGLQHLHNGRACGRDGLPAELLRYARVDSSPHVLAPILVDAFNAASVVGKVPACFNYALVTPVHKKGDKLNTQNYRPIAVTDSVMRLYASS